MPRRPDSARSSRAKPWWELKPESYRGVTIRKVRDRTFDHGSQRFRDALRYQVEAVFVDLKPRFMPFTKKRLAKEWIDTIKADPKRFGTLVDKKVADKIKAKAQRETERRLGAR